MNEQRRLYQLLLQNAQRRAGVGNRAARNDEDTAYEGDDDGDDPEGVPFEIVNDVCNVYAFGVIDAWWGISAEEMIEALTGAGGRPVHLYINSPGGDAIEARAICAAIVAHPAPVYCHIVGMCASAATQLALAGDRCDMVQGSLYMIHEAWTLGWGNKRELAKCVALLGKIDDTIAQDYARRTGKTAAEMLALMEAETWYTPDEAKAAGLIDAIAPNSRRPAADAGGASNTATGKLHNLLASPQASASRWNVSAYRNAPKPDDSAQRAAQAAAELAAAVAQQRQHNANRLRLLAA